VLAVILAWHAAPGVALADPVPHGPSASAPVWKHEMRIPEYIPTRASSIRAELDRATPEADDTAPTGFVSTDHAVRPGDTLAAIASSYGLPLSAVLANNPTIDPDRLLVGATVVVPGGDGLVYEVAPGDTVRSIAAAYGITARDIRAFTPNRLFRADLLTPGAEILLPGAEIPVVVEDPTPVETPTPRHTEEPEPVETPEPEAPEPPAADPALPPGPAHTVDGLNLRDGPGTSYPVLMTMTPMQDVEITGAPVDGFFPVWTAGMTGWAAGDYLSEGYAPAPPPAPAPEPAEPAPGALGWDDYPYSGSTDIDPWGFEGSNCTSFVAWRMNNTFGVPFRADFAGGWWGDAGYWDSSAATAGYLVDDIPTVGAIAQWRGDETIAGYGHVAIVLAVYDDSSVLIEEYNAVVPYGYSQRVVYAPRFIHLTP